MAFQAEQVDIAALEQTRIVGAVRRVAGNAAFSLDGRVLPRKRTGLVGMAAEAHLVLRRGSAQLASQEPAVLVVAVAAVDQSFVDAMMEGLGEIGLYFLVAGVAQRRLRGLQKLPVDLGIVHGVAIHAAHVVLQVLGPQEVAVLFAKLVAAQAAF